MATCSYCGDEGAQSRSLETITSNAKRYSDHIDCICRRCHTWDWVRWYIRLLPFVILAAAGVYFYHTGLLNPDTNIDRRLVFAVLGVFYGCNIVGELLYLAVTLPRVKSNKNIFNCLKDAAFSILLSPIQSIAFIYGQTPGKRA